MAGGLPSLPERQSGTAHPSQSIAHGANATFTSCSSIFNPCCIMQGNCEVNVECREDVKGSFGFGRKTRMQFGAFLDRIVKGDTSLYLTTQEVLMHPLLWARCWPFTAFLTHHGAASTIRPGRRPGLKQTFIDLLQEA